jgi:glucokinase
MEAALAIDIGGTKLAVGVVDEAGAVLARRDLPTEGHSSAEHLFDSLSGLVDEVRASVDATPVLCGVGCGGPMERGGEAVSPLNIPVWRGFPLRSRLAERTQLPTWVDNDAKALALAEGWLGAAVGQRDFIAMVVSTGVGGGIVSDGRLVDGSDGNAGHVGHVIVEPDGRACRCGGRGCLEAEASGTAIQAITGRHPREAGPDVIARTGRLVGRALASVANLLDLPLACVAGSVALGYGEPFFRAAQDELTARARLSFSHDARIVPAGLGKDGPVIGAAAVALRNLEDRPTGIR